MMSISMTSTVDLTGVCAQSDAVLQFQYHGMINTRYQDYDVVRMSRNVSFVDVHSMLEHAFNLAISKQGRWQIVAEAFINDRALETKGFVMVQNNVVLFRTFDLGYESSLYRDCQLKGERMEKVLQSRLDDGSADMRNTIKVVFSDRKKAINTLAIAAFGVYPKSGSRL